MAARKSGTTPATPAAPSRDDVLKETLTRMGACDTHAQAGRLVNVPEARLSSFRQSIRNDGTFRSKGDANDATSYASAYANQPLVRRYVDAFVDGIVGTPAE